MARSKRLGFLLCALSCSSVFAGDAIKDFTLGRYVPENAWMYIHELNTEERAFICEHNDRVAQAFLDSGIINEVRTLIASNMTDDTQRASFENQWKLVHDAVQDVPWDSLAATEFVYAQQMVPMVPRHIFLFRSEGASLDGTRKKLVELLDTIGALMEKKTSHEKRGDVDVWSLPLFRGVFSVEIFQKGDILCVSSARGGTDDVLALMEGKSGAKSILEHPDVVKAITMAAPPEDGLYIFRLSMFLDQIKAFVNAAIHKAGEHRELGGDQEQEVRTVKGIIFHIIEELNFVDTVVSTRRTEGLQEIISSRVTLTPDFAKKPFALAFTQQKQIAQFDKHVPEEASGFSLWSGVDITILYDAVIDFIGKEVPDGEAALKKWEKVQTDIGFNLKNDLLSWISGEMISVTLPGAMPGQSNAVLMLRTSDAKLAAEKINGWLDMLAAFGQENQIMVGPCPEVEAEGFRSVFHPMMMMAQMKPVIGVNDGWLMIATSPKALNMCLATAAGKHPSIRANTRFQNEGLSPEGPVSSASFTDLSNLGQEMAMAFGMMGMASGFMPDKPEMRPIKSIFTMMTRLAPVMAQIDYLSSSASTSRFVGDGWESKIVVTYKPTEKTMSAKSDDAE